MRNLDSWTNFAYAIQQEVELLSMIKRKWNFVFDRPKRQEAEGLQNPRRHRERRRGAWNSRGTAVSRRWKRLVWEKFLMVWHVYHSDI